jgi:hypothetical protein
MMNMYKNLKMYQTAQNMGPGMANLSYNKSPGSPHGTGKAKTNSLPPQREVQPMGTVTFYAGGVPVMSSSQSPVANAMPKGPMF